MVVAIVVVAVITNNKQKWLLRTHYMFQKFLIEDLNLKNSIKHCLTLLNTAISINMLRWVITVYTFYYKFRFREVTIFFNVTCLMNGGNGRRTKEVNGLNHLHCNLVLDWLLLRFFFLLVCFIFLVMDLRSPISLPSYSLNSIPIRLLTSHHNTESDFINAANDTQFPKVSGLFASWFYLIYQKHLTQFFSPWYLFSVDFQDWILSWIFPHMLELHFDLYFCILLFSLTFKIEGTLVLVHDELRPHGLNTTYVLTTLKFVFLTHNYFVTNSHS